MPSGTEEKQPLTGFGKALRAFGLVLVVLLGFVWFSIIVSLVEDSSGAADAIVGGMVVTVILVVIAVVLFRVANSNRRAPGSGTTPTADRAPSMGSSSTPSATRSGTGVASFIRPGERVLAQANGFRPGSEGLQRLLRGRSLIPIVIAGIVASMYFGGFVFLLLIGVVVARVIRGASSQGPGGDPAVATVVVTDQRILAFARKWQISGPVTPWFAYQLADVVSQSISDEGNQPSLELEFSDGRTVSMLLERSSAVAVVAALGEAGI